MASCKQRSNGKWLARYRDATGKEITRTFLDKQSGLDWARTQETTVRTGTHINPNDTTTVGEYATKYVDLRYRNPRSRSSMGSLCRVHIVGTPLGDRPLNRVTRSEVQTWANGRALVLAPVGARMAVTLLSSVYAAAVLDSLIAKSPVTKIALDPPPPRHFIPLTVEQVRDLSAAMPAAGPYRTMVVVQAATGLRVGELLALRRIDIDLTWKNLNVRQQLTKASRGVPCPPKTRSSVRTVPIPVLAVNALRDHMRRHPPEGDNGFVFTNNGHPFSYSRYQAIFAAAAKRAGITARTHDLRHHYASMLLDAGLSVVAVAARLGHTNAQQVIKTYGHLMPGSDDRTRTAIDDAWDTLRGPNRGEGAQ
jgi:integrase